MNSSKKTTPRNRLMTYFRPRQTAMKGPSTGSVLGLTVVLIATSAAVWALNEKDVFTRLDQMVLIDPHLRVVETPVDVQEIRDQVPNIGAVDAFRETHGSAWRVIYDSRRGAPTVIKGGAIPLIPGPSNNLRWEDFGAECAELKCLPQSSVEAAARGLLSDHERLIGVDTENLTLDPDGTIAVGRSIYLVRFQQTHGGVPVEEGSLYLRVNGGNLIQIATENIATVKLDPSPAITADTAWDVVRGHLGELADGEDHILDPGTLMIVPVTPSGADPDVFNGPVGSGIDHRLVWRIRFVRSGEIGTWEALIDAHTGELVLFVDANRYGQIHGGAYPADDHVGESDRPFPFADTGLPAPNDYADAAGRFPGDTATTTLTGKYTWIDDNCGQILGSTTTSDLDFSMGPGLDCDVPDLNNGGPGNTHSTRTQYYHLTMVNIKARSYMPTNSWLNTDHMNVVVNGSPWCNATSGFGTLNFYRADTGCWNLGELPAVSLHEWGHSMDDFDGSGGDSSPVETRADWTAILQTHDSCIGRGFYLAGDCDGDGDACLDCNGVRDGDWDAHANHTPWTAANHGTFWNCVGGLYYGPCGWSDHCESGIATQALWDLVNRDLTGQGLDLASAWMLVDRLFYSAMPTLGTMYTCSAPTSSGCNGASLYNTLMALDDDGDGTANGTPHAASIFAALDRHNIACGTASDPENQNSSSCPALGATTVTGVGENDSAVLSWDPVPGATRYLVYRNDIDCNAGFVKVGEVAAPGLSFTDTNVANHIEYNYRIQPATDIDACAGPMSACEAVTPLPCQTSSEPTALATAPNGDNSIFLSWTSDDPVADTFNVYRSIGGCPQADPELVATDVTGTTWTDEPVSGQITYGYTVTAVDVTGGCESQPGPCSSSATTGPCTQAPSFDGIAEVINPGNDVCTMNLSWPAATSHCGGPSSYNIYRSTDPDFVPDPSMRIAAEVTTTDFDDLAVLTSGVRYFYIVRAVDSANGVEDDNLVSLGGVPTGAGGGVQTILQETFEGDWPAPGWQVIDNIGNANIWERSDLAGAVNRTTGVGGAGFSAAADPDAVDSAGGWNTELRSPVLDLASAASATLTYASNFQDFAGNGDIWLEASIDGGSTWTTLRTQTEDDPSGGTFETEDLGAFVGENVILRWRYVCTDDTAWYWHIDTVTVEADIMSSCVTGSACPENPFVDITPDGPLTLCSGSTQELTAGLVDGTPPYAYQWTEDGIAIGGAEGSTYNATAVGSSNYNCNVRGDGCPDHVFDPNPVQITWQEQPVFDGLDAAFDRRASICTIGLSWGEAVPVCGGPASYTIYRSDDSDFIPGPETLIADGITATSFEDGTNLVSGTPYHYIVRATDEFNGAEDSNAVVHSAIPSGPDDGVHILLTEHFEGSWPPPDWHVVDNLGNGWVWNQTVSQADNETTGVGGAGLNAAADPDFEGNPRGWDTELRSPSVDLRSASNATLSYASNFQDYAGNGDIWVDVSTDGGSTWTTIRTQSSDDPSGGTFEVEDLSAFVGEVVIIRWRYTCGTGLAWYWHIDTVTVEAEISDPCTTGVSMIFADGFEEGDTERWSDTVQ
jgi:hypothetical protein